MTHALTSCSACNVCFTAEDFPRFDPSLVFTTCYHIFHKECLKGWVKEKESCPNCNGTVYEHAHGLNFPYYRKIFLEALGKNPEIILQTLQESNHLNSVCTAGCLDELPVIPLRFDKENNRLVHDRCAGTKDMPNLLMEDFAKIMKKVAEKNPNLQQSLKPPSRLWTSLYKHPWIFGAVVIELVSMGALMLNRYKFEGQNWALSAIGAPAYLTLVLAHQVGLLFFTVLNNK